MTKAEANQIVVNEWNRTSGRPDPRLNEALVLTGIAPTKLRRCKTAAKGVEVKLPSFVLQTPTGSGQRR